ncbi:amidohydrolase [Curtobacterium sp. MCPF17_031]|nr:amidohydrolase [Curtobacterium sp. MCPF17_031]
MRVIDSQLHLGPGQIDTTLASMDALGIDSVLVDEFWARHPSGHPDFFEPGRRLPGGAWRSAFPTAETAALLHEDRFATVVRVDPDDDGLSWLVPALAAEPHVKALRVLPTWSEGAARAFAEGSCDRLFGLAADVGLPVFVYTPGRTALLRGYLRRFPALTVVIDHCGMPQPGLPVPSPSAEPGDGRTHPFDAVLSLAEHGNVALKWSHEQVVFGSEQYPFLGTRPHLRRALDAFGAERIMWAGDHTALPGMRWSEVLHAVRDNPELGAAERDAVLGGTAERILRWTPGAGAADGVDPA